MDIDEGREPWGALRHAQIRFSPLGWVMRGCSLVVVNVDTELVSDPSGRRTWVLVRVDGL